ncbi:MAG: DUF4350 domain-containing protein [Myxococcota bacterium]|nr:DUF4350 domain-containing protein [Myxococcota bacterium]
MGLLAAVLGLVFLCFALIGLVLGAHLWVLYLHFGVGVAALLFAGITSFGELREQMGRGSSRRGMRAGGNAVLQFVVLGVILGLLGFLSVRHSVRWDWTEGNVHTLSAGTLSVLDQIPDAEPVELLAFVTPALEPQFRKLLDQYSYETPKLDIEYVDPRRDPGRTQRYEVRADGTLLVCAGPCETASGTARVTAASEPEVTRAIRSVISEKHKIYFVTGHGEADIEDDQAEGFSRARDALRDENLEVEPLLLAAEEEVPSDAAAVVVAGPDRSLLGRELGALDRYLQRGGSLLFLVDPILTTGLEAPLRDWGVELGADIIIDQQIQLFAGPQIGVQPIVSSYAEHPVTEDLASQPTSFYLSRSVRASDPGDEQVVELALTGPGSWAETDLELFLEESTVGVGPADRAGPVAVALVRRLAPADGQAEGGLLAVVGDSDFGRNGHIAEFYNADLLMNLVNWLVGDEEFATIERNLPRASVVVLTPEEVDNFRYVSLFAFPEALLVLGVWVWWRRRT